MNLDEGLRTPSKGPRPSATPSPSNASKGSAKKGIKNAKITNFFPKVNSPMGRNNSNSNHEQSENDQQQIEDLSRDASSSSIKVPDQISLEIATNKKTDLTKEYVFIVPSSDDDTNVSSKGSAVRRRKPPSVHSNNSRSSDGFVLTRTNNELGIEPKRRTQKTLAAEKHDSNSNNEIIASSPVTRSSSRDSRSRDSIPEKRLRAESAQIQNFNQNSSQRINRIQPTLIGTRTKMIDFQSVPSDLNMPRDKAMNLIHKLFLVKMPEDFFLFWDFAKTINHRKPCSAFAQGCLDWTLVGPYDVLSGLITDFHGFSKESLLRHCRFYFDPPEFQTVIVKKDAPKTHYGYFRDEPDQVNPIVVMNRLSQGGQLHEVGDNLFTLLKGELESAIGSLSKASQEAPPLTSSSSKAPRGSKSSETSNKQSQLEKAKAKQELTIIRDKLIDFCSSHPNLSCESWSRTNGRHCKRNAKTLNTVGIVVPMDGDVGYRALGLTDNKLKTILNRISDFKDDDKTKCNLYKDIHQLITNSNLANDECDFGMGLELGLDLFYNGDTFFHKDIEFLLTNAYTLLGRNEYIEILKAHLSDRKKDDKVSLLEVP